MLFRSEALLNSITTEEFTKIFADVAKQTLKDPTQLQRALRNFRLAEELGDAPQPDEQDLARAANARANPTANTADVTNAGLQVSKSFTSMLAAAMKLKGVNPTQLVKKAFDSLPKDKFAGLQPQQINMAMGRAVQVFNAILTNRAKIASDPNVAKAPAKAPAAAPAKVQEKKQIARWNKLAGVVKG